jgi:hypothetical protein
MACLYYNITLISLLYKRICLEKYLTFEEEILNLNFGYNNGMKQKEEGI